MASIPTTRASNVIIKNGGDDFFQFIGEGGNTVSWIDSSGIAWGGLTTPAATSISGNASTGSLFNITDTNASLGQNSAETFATIKSAASAAGTVFNWNIYGDGTVGAQLYSAGVAKSGMTIDVTNGGGFQGYTTLGNVAVGFLGTKGFSSGFLSYVQASVGDILNGVPPNPGEVSWAASGKRQVAQGTAVPLSGYGTNNVDSVIVSSTDSSATNGAIAITTIFSSNGALTIASAAVVAGVVTLTTNQNIPSMWMVGETIKVTGITSTGGSWNTTGGGAAITAIGNKTVSYASVTASGTPTTSQGVVVPINGGITATAAIVNNNSNNSYISSATHSAGTVQINIGGQGTSSKFITGYPILVSGFLGDTAINGTWVVTAASGIAGGAIQYAVAGSGSPTLGATGTVQLAVPKYYMGAGLYELKGYIANEITVSANTATVTVTYTDESGLTNKTQSVSGSFTSQGDIVSFNFVFAIAGATDVRITISGSATMPNIYQLNYRLVHY